MDWDEPRHQPTITIVVGEDLTRMSVAELDARVAALRAEITRVEVEIARKRKQQSAADALFKR